MNTHYRVLVAEDDYLIKQEICRSLQKIGHQIVGEASDGNEAFQLTCTIRPDVVVIDIKMPECDGIEATKMIQKVCPTPVVILTAHETDEFIAQASEAGAGAYLTKPPKKEEIQRAIVISIARHKDFLRIKKLSDDLLKALDEKDLVIKEMKDALDNLGALSEIVPICASCRKVQNDKGHWKRIEEFVSEHPDIQLAHELCPDCLNLQEDRNVKSPQKIQLSSREKDVLMWIRDGKNTWDISKILGITENTVKFHVTSILRKTNTVTRAQAVATAMRLGLLDN